MIALPFRFAWARPLSFSGNVALPLQAPFDVPVGLAVAEEDDVSGAWAQGIRF